MDNEISYIDSCTSIYSRMERSITLLNAASPTLHCTLPPLSAAVIFRMVIKDGLGPEVVSVVVILV